MFTILKKVDFFEKRLLSKVSLIIIATLYLKLISTSRMGCWCSGLPLTNYMLYPGRKSRVRFQSHFHVEVEFHAIPISTHRLCGIT